MRIIRIITLFILTANICFGQFKLKQMERCFDMASQSYLDSCFIMTDSRGFQTYIDLSVLKQIAGTPSPSALCAAIAGFGIGSLQINDYVIARNSNGTCKLIPINNIVSQGALCSAFNATSLGTYTIGDRLLFQRADGTCYRDSIRWDQYGGLDCNGVIDCISTNPDFCTEVQNCISSTYICQTLNGFGGMNFIPQYLIGINNGQCAKVDGNLFGSAAICSNLNLLGYSGAVDTVFGTYNGQCYKVALPSGGSNWNCDSTQNCLSGQWFCDSIANCLSEFLCDSIEACLTNNPKFDTLVCEALHSFPFQQASSTGDTVIAVNGGTCYKTVLNTGGSNWNCDSTVNCVNQFLCDSVLACISNSLFACEEVESSWQSGQLGNGALLLIQDGTECKKATLGFENTACISMGLSGSGNFTASTIISGDAGNKVECRANGLYASGVPTCAELGALFSNGGQIGATDQIMTAGCVYKTLGNQLSCPNIGVAFPAGGALAPGDEVLVYSDAGCQRKTLPCYDPCGGVPDINPRLISRLDALEKENKELRKIIKDIQNKLK
jgi:hypothetical protein